MYGHVITKFSRMGSLPHFLTHGAPLRALRARERRQNANVRRLSAYIFNNIHTCYEPEVVSQKQKDASSFQSLHGCPTHSKGGNTWSNFASVGDGLFDNFIADE